MNLRYLISDSFDHGGFPFVEPLRKLVRLEASHRVVIPVLGLRDHIALGWFRISRDSLTTDELTGSLLGRFVSIEKRRRRYRLWPCRADLVDEYSPSCLAHRISSCFRKLSGELQRAVRMTPHYCQNQRVPGEEIVAGELVLDLQG